MSWTCRIINFCNDRIKHHAFLLIPAQGYVGKFLNTFKEFPPRQKAASFTVDQVMEQLLTPPHGR